MSWSAEVIAPCAKWLQDSAFLTRRCTTGSRRLISRRRELLTQTHSLSLNGELKRLRKENAELKQDRDPPQGVSFFRQGDEPLNRFRFVSAHRDQYPVTALCRVTKVSRSGYYAWAAGRRHFDASTTPI